MTHTRQELPKDYCDNVLDVGSGLKKLFPLIAEALSRDSLSHGINSKNVKKCKEGTIKELRSSLKGRLLAIQRKYNNKPYWIMLPPDIPDHDINKHPLMKETNGLAKFLQKNKDKLLEEVRELELKEAKRLKDLAELASNEEEFNEKESPSSDLQSTLSIHLSEEEKPELEEKVETEEAQTESEMQITVEEYDYYNNQLISHNEKQREALNASQPLIVNGLPGTGKSCVLMKRLLNALERAADEKEPERVLYLADSKNLCDNMRNMRKSSPDFHEEDTNKIEFKTYFELLKELEPGIHGKELAGKKYFLDWIKNYKKNPELLETLRTLLPEDTELGDALYQECRRISALKKSECEEMGERQSFFAMENESINKRKKLGGDLHSLLKDYRNYLDQTDHIDPVFYKLNPDIKDIFYQIGLDEVQNLGPLQLVIMARLTKTQTVARYLPKNDGDEQPAPTKKNISLFYDGHQNLHDSLSKLSALKKIFGKELQEIELTESLRCSKKVIAVANTILEMGVFVTGGQDKGITHEMSTTTEAEEGRTTWIDVPTEKQKDEIQTLIQSHKCAVIVPPELVKAAEEEFSYKVIEDGVEIKRTAQILTVEQAIGLEFETVILWRMLENSRYQKISSLLTNFKECKKNNKIKKTGRGKYNSKVQDEKIVHPVYGPDISALLIAATRAKKSAIFHNHSPNKETRNKLRHIRDIFQDQMTANGASSAPLSDKLGKSTKQDWIKQIEANLRMNNIIVAKNLYLQYIKNNVGDFTEFYKDFLKKNETTQNIVPPPVVTYTSETLKNLVKNSDKTFKKQLIKMLDNQSPCLFEIDIEGRPWHSWINQNSSKRKILHDLLKEKKYAKKFTPEYLKKLTHVSGVETSILSYIMQEDSDLFSILLTTHSTLAKDLSSYCQIPSKKTSSELDNIPTENLSENKDSKQFIESKRLETLARKLELLLNKTPDEFESDLKDIFDNENLVECLFAVSIQGKSLFYFINNNQLLSEKLRNIFRDAKYAQKITASYLRTITRSQDGKQTLLAHLLCFDYRLLSIIFDNNSEIAKDLKAEDLKPVLIDFCALAPKTLLNIFKVNKNKDLIKIFTFEDLIKEYKDGSNTVYYLCGEESLDLLDEFIQNISGFEKITAELLFKKVKSINIGSQVRINFSCMASLALTANGCSKILKFLELNPNIPYGITVDDLLLPFAFGTTPIDAIQSTCYHRMQMYPDGKRALEIIFNTHKQLRFDIVKRRVSQMELKQGMLQESGVIKNENNKMSLPVSKEVGETISLADVHQSMFYYTEPPAQSEPAQRPKLQSGKTSAGMSGR